MTKEEYEREMKALMDYWRPRMEALSLGFGGEPIEDQKQPEQRYAHGIEYMFDYGILESEVIE